MTFLLYFIQQDERGIGGCECTDELEEMKKAIIAEAKEINQIQIVPRPTKGEWKKTGKLTNVLDVCMGMP